MKHVKHPLLGVAALLAALMILPLAVSCAQVPSDPASQEEETGIRETLPETLQETIPPAPETQRETDAPALPACDHDASKNEIVWHTDVSCFAYELTRYHCDKCGEFWEVTGTEKPEHEYVDGLCIHCGLNEGADTCFKFTRGDNSDFFTCIITGFADDCTQADREKESYILPTVACVSGEVLPVRVVRNVFRGCTKVRSVVIPEGYVTIGKNTFEGATALEEISLPSTLEVISDSAFAKCPSLVSVRVPENVKSIGQSVFEGCTGLREILLPDGCESIGSRAFFGCKFDHITLPSSLTAIPTYLFNGNSNLKEITLPEKIVFIGEFAFSNTGITELTIPASVGTFSLRAVSWTNIRELILPDSVTRADGNIENCPELEVIHFPDTLTVFGPVTELPKLRSINIPYAMTRLDVGQLVNCPSLAEIIIAPDHPLFEIKGELLIRKKDKTVVSVLGDVRELIIPDDGSVLAIGPNACQGRKTLERVVIPGCVETVGTLSFDGCTSLSSVELGEGLGLLDSYCFRGCSALTSIAFPEGVTVNACIISGCSSLKEVFIPLDIRESRTKDLDQLFDHASALERVVYAGTKADWADLDAKTNVTYFLPDGTVIACRDGEIIFRTN